MFKGFNFAVCFIIGLVIASEAQITRHFEVVGNNEITLVNLSFSCYKGVTDVKRVYKGIPFNAHADLGKVNILPTFTHHTKDGVLSADLEHKNVESESLSKNLSYRFFSGNDDDFDHKWQVGLDANYLYNLKLHFGIGKARLDLSNLSISNCIIKTASTDVYLNYSKRTPNSVAMDSLLVSINMGSLYAEELHFSNARELMLDVNYGSINLSFNDLMASPSNIRTMVGAGSVNIKLPPEDLPYIIKINSTAMCRTKIPSYLKEIDTKTYVSKGYRNDAKNLMTFMIDVSVGSVSLE
ncbi:MAG: hypothetical protein WD431_15325 [Cyclobacteriaceae bacterium]